MLLPMLAGAAQLTMDEGVVVKFGDGAGLVVRDTLRTDRDVEFTSLADDSVGGQSRPTTGTPHTGDWSGVILDPAVLPANVTLDGLRLRYAGGAGGAALSSFQQRDYAFTELSVRDSLIGIRAASGGTARLTELFLTGNGVGLQALGGATPTLTGSDLHDNTRFGVENQNPATVVLATGNWWGDLSGPADPVGNPSGLGDPVSTGVDYGQFLSTPPLLNCAVTPQDGYTTRGATITLQLTCTNATDYRLSELADLSDTSFVPMAASATFTLSATPGEKTIYAEYRGADGATRIVSITQPILYAPDGPQITLLTPTAGAIITDDTLIQAQASDDQGLSRVEFWIDTTRLATVTTPPYQILWALGTLANGSHTIKAIAINTLQQSATTQITVTVQREDHDGPTLELLFNGVPLAANATVTTPGTLTLKASDTNGVQTVTLAFDGQTMAADNAGGVATFIQSRTLDFSSIPNGSHTVAVTATDTAGNSRTLSVPFVLNLAPPVVPQITVPANGATVTQATLTLSGTAQAGSQIQLYLNDVATGSLLTVNTSGGFSAAVTLSAEGSYTLSADARNVRGTSARSETVTVNFQIAPPTVLFVSPAQNAILIDTANIQINALDASGIVEVALSMDGQLLTQLTEAPYQYMWDTTTVAEGTHVLTAVATANSGKSTRVERSVTVRKTPEPLPPTPYTGEVSAIAPVVSYGPQVIQITGRAIDRSDQAVPNATLRLVLQVGRFQRQIALASDSTGAFQYTFVPQDSDAGTYRVSVIHPDETTWPDQGQFTINRVRFNLNQYGLLAVRGFPSTIAVTATASAGTGVQGLHWVARPGDQPSGALPSGIHIDGGTGIDLAASASAPIAIAFSADTNAAQETGTIILTALATDSGTTPRGTLRIDYRLGDARPALFADPTYLDLGVRQNETVSGNVRIGNRGLATATGVTARLVGSDGGTPPAWLFLASTATLGALDVGQNQLVQVTAAPGATVADGVYTAKIRIAASNATGGDVPVSVSVTQQGEGGVRFHVSDIFTETLDAQGQRILGVTGATLTLQNEAVTSIQQRVVTDAEGIALIEDLPPGAYRYRVSAPNHGDASGRLQIQPGVILSQSVFLDYALISVSFNVTETTIQDHYDLTLTATYLTQVPAPVVLMEPLAINLPDLQVGESITGELTITNYGLVRADEVVFAPPESDDYYTYEWLVAVPESLPAKTRITVPYRITAHTLPSRAFQMKTVLEPLMGAMGDGRFAKTLREVIGGQLKSSSCSSYSVVAGLSYDYECANGEVRAGGASTVISHIRGSNCTSSAGPQYGPLNPRCTATWCHDGGGFGGGGGSSSSAIPLTPSCTPDCSPNSSCCGGAGGGSSGGGGSGPGGGGPGGPSSPPWGGSSGSMGDGGGSGSGGSGAP